MGRQPILPLIKLLLLDPVTFIVQTMKCILTILLVTIVASYGNAQEICNNGKDDDNDGLVDLKDPGCSCKDSLPALNYLENPSFEDYVTCPTDPSNGLGLQQFPYWSSAPERGSVRYYNLDCPYKYYFHTNTDSFPPPYPLPDGKGYIQISDYGDIGFGNKYYAAGCVKNTLYANQKYSFECFIGFSPNDMRGDYFKSPLKLTLFGNADCAAYQFTNYISYGCPLVIDPDKPNNDWVQLASVNVYGKGNWVKVRIDFIPPEDVNLLLVGPDCQIFGLGYGAIYYADNFSLSAEENFAFKTISVSNDCAGAYN